MEQQMKIEWGKLKFELIFNPTAFLVGAITAASILALLAPVSCGIYQELHPERYRPLTERTVITNGK
jgi:hypothetical protein